MLDVTVVSVVRDVKVNLSAKDWQLYTTVAGADEAAEKLNRAVEAGVRTQGQQAARKEIMSVMEELSGVGASDTEPRHVIVEVLNKIYDKE
jgi:hypothetical protein